jgi:hypothetical protein
MESLTDYLSEWGVAISDREFLVLLRNTLDEIAGKDLWAEPEQELPPEELELLRGGGFSTRRESLGSDDPVFRGALDFSALIATAVSTKEAARLLDVDPSRIRQRLTGPCPSLYGVKWRGGWLLPRFQFVGKAEVPGLDEVVPHLDPGLNPVAVGRWFLSPSPDLVVDQDDGEAMSPRDWLLAGHSPMEVARLAEGL